MPGSSKGDSIEAVTNTIEEKIENLTQKLMSRLDEMKPTNDTKRKLDDCVQRGVLQWNENVEKVKTELQEKLSHIKTQLNGEQWKIPGIKACSS